MDTARRWNNPFVLVSFGASTKVVGKNHFLPVFPDFSTNVFVTSAHEDWRDLKSETRLRNYALRLFEFFLTFIELLELFFGTFFLELFFKIFRTVFFGTFFKDF